MKLIVNSITTFILFLACSSLSHAGAEIENLSPGLRDLLRKEMVALEQGMKAIIPAYIRGDTAEIADIGRQMKNSYIQRQQITKAQSQELREKLPSAFTARDKDFHKLAGMLQQAAEQQQLELVGFYYLKTLEACAACHSEYAVHRFPRLATDPEQDHDHH